MSSYNMSPEEQEEYEFWEVKRSSELMEIDEQTGLCMACTRILDGESFSHHNTWFLERSAQAECQVCGLFFESIKHSLPAKRQFNVHTAVAEITFSKRGDRLFYKLGNREWVFDLFDKSPSVGFSEAGVDWYGRAVGWLNECCEGHPECAQPMPKALPSRLLDLSNDSIRLTTKENLSQSQGNVEYCILSYCWGETANYVTTKDNINSHMSKIDLSDLPKTVQDAVIVARKLGLSYLWVDALCIIQGQPEDWANECSQMVSYYRHAKVTISALDAKQASAGFLKGRKPWKEIQLCPFLNQHIRLRPPEWKNVLRDAALSDRGWALQERILSTRVLHFAGPEVLWECLTCSAREAFPGQHTAVIGSSNTVDSESQDFKRSLWRVGEDPFSIDDGLYSLWYRIVRLYMKRRLTVKTDRLPAIEGIAKFISSSLGGESQKYFAGIWVTEPHSLLWSFEMGPARASTDAKYYTPSWSWSTADAAIDYMLYSEDRLASKKDDTEISILQSDSPSKRSTRFISPRDAPWTLKISAQSRLVRLRKRYDAAEDGQISADDRQAMRVGAAYTTATETVVFGTDGSTRLGSASLDVYGDEFLNKKSFRIIRVGDRLAAKDTPRETPMTYFLIVEPVDAETGEGMEFEEDVDPLAVDGALDQRSSPSPAGQKRKREAVTQQPILWRRVGIGKTKDWDAQGWYSVRDVFDKAARRDFLLV